MSATRIVKRYANRKLYDTERSCYVTLEDIAIMIKESALVKVIDNKSGEDLTTVTLAQIIFETEKKQGFMPLDLLRTLIQGSSEKAKEMTERGLGNLQAKASSMVSEMVEKVEELVPNQITPAANEDGVKTTVSDLASMAKESFERLQSIIGKKINGPEGNTARNASLGRDMEDIRRRLAELEERLLQFGNEVVS